MVPHRKISILNILSILTPSPPSQADAEEMCSILQQAFQLVYTEATMEHLNDSISAGERGGASLFTPPPLPASSPHRTAAAGGGTLEGGERTVELRRVIACVCATTFIWESLARMCCFFSEGFYHSQLVANLFLGRSFLTLLLLIFSVYIVQNEFIFWCFSGRWKCSGCWG